MKVHKLSSMILVVVLCCKVVAQANVFNMGGTRNVDGSWTGLASLETVPVGNFGNTGEWSGQSYGGFGPDRICGAVGYAYNIGKYEVTAAQYTEFLNAVARTSDPYWLYNELMWSAPYGCKIQRTLSSGVYTYSVAADLANRPVNYVVSVAEAVSAVCGEFGLHKKGASLSSIVKPNEENKDASKERGCVGVRVGQSVAA